MLKTILSIDDSKAVHAFLDRCLVDSAFQLIHALSAEEGLALLKNDVSKFCLILLDWEMPGQNGPEALLEIRRITKSIPVIMLSSKSATEDIQSMIESGAAEYVMKPFTPDILIQKIESTLGVL